MFPPLSIAQIIAIFLTAIAGMFLTAARIFRVRAATPVAPEAVVTENGEHVPQASMSEKKEESHIASSSHLAKASPSVPLIDRLQENYINPNDSGESQWSNNTDELLRLSSSSSDGPRRGVAEKHFFRGSKHLENLVNGGTDREPASGVSGTVQENPASDRAIYVQNRKQNPIRLRVVSGSSSRTDQRDLPTSTTHGSTSRPVHPPQGPVSRFADQDESRSESFRFTIPITEDGGVRKLIEAVGAGVRPQCGAVVEYFHKISTNAQFKCPKIYKMTVPSKTTLNSAELIAGLELGLISMQVGERAIFRVEPNYAYGMTKSNPLNISPKDVLYIYVELLKIQPVEEAVRFLQTEVTERPLKFSPAQLTVVGEQLQDMGKTEFRQGEYSQASQLFQQAIVAQETKECLEDVPLFANQRNSMLAQLQNNIAVCCLKEKQWVDVTKHAQKALDLKADSASMAKACYLLAKAASVEKGMSSAVVFVKRGLRINKNHPELISLLKECQPLKTDPLDPTEQSKKIFQIMTARVSAEPNRTPAVSVVPSVLAPAATTDLPGAAVSTTVPAANGFFRRQTRQAVVVGSDRPEPVPAPVIIESDASSVSKSFARRSFFCSLNNRSGK